MANNSRRGGALAVAVLIVAGAAAAAPSRAAVGQGDCAQPHYPPVASADGYSGSQEVLPQVPGQSALVQVRAPQLDSDGDGRRDEVATRTHRDDPSSLTRGDGTLTFEQGGVMLGMPQGLGDLDGDGRDEIQLVMVSLSDQTVIGAYVVPGSTPPGTHDPDEVGVRLAYPLRFIGDRNGDGTGDFIEDVDQSRSTDPDDSHPSRVLSGAAIGAIEPPADAGDLPVIAELQGQFHNLVDLGGALPAIITGTIVTPEGLLLRIWDGEKVTSFQTSPYPYVLNYGVPLGRIEVVRSDKGTFITIHQSERSAARSYLWWLENPCAPLQDIPTPTSAPVAPDAPVARPVQTEASYTG